MNKEDSSKIFRTTKENPCTNNFKSSSKNIGQSKLLNCSKVLSESSLIKKVKKRPENTKDENTVDKKCSSGKVSVKEAVKETDKVHILSEEKSGKSITNENKKSKKKFLWCLPFPLC